ncbi:hypothetical protein EON65_41935 [archaeon]|nr:MAG: hypothetical protein EON65_41935 [archaeon]
MDCIYAQELAKQAVARAAFARGVKNVDKVALDAISDVLRHYIQNLGEGAKDQAELAGRAAPGIHDVLKVLEQTVSFTSLGSSG